MVSVFKNKINDLLLNIPGWKSNRKILVIESDDWGTIRLSSKEALKKLSKNSSNLKLDGYNTFDSLESNEDMEALFDVVTSIKNKDGKHPIITANINVANPDFIKIKKDNFNCYHFEVFTKTLKKYPKHDRVEVLYKQGIANEIFIPQFHGREHLHYTNWLNALRSKDKETLEVFENNMFTFSNKTNSNCKSQFLDAFGTYSDIDFKNLIISIEEGLIIFENLWGYKATSVMPPCTILHPKTENLLNKNGIQFIQGYAKQEIPVFGKETYEQKRIYTGLENKSKQIYTVRNAKFEPSLVPNNQWAEFALKNIADSFFWNKPAILASHRVNFIGSIDEDNRKQNLIMFKQLLKEVVKKWPDVEFMSSDQLGILILNSIKKQSQMN